MDEDEQSEGGVAWDERSEVELMWFEFGILIRRLFEGSLRADEEMGRLIREEKWRQLRDRILH